MERVQSGEGSVVMLCTLCQTKTQHRLLVSGRPTRLRHSPVHDLRHYAFCCDCGSRQSLPSRPGDH